MLLDGLRIYDYCKLYTAAGTGSAVEPGSPVARVGPAAVRKLGVPGGKAVRRGLGLNA